MASMRELKGRIESVHSSQKITGAMKMISSARLRKAENKLLQSAPYRRKLWEIYKHIRQSGCEYVSPWVAQREVKKIALVVLASDDGLCGAFNINLFKRLVEAVHHWQAKDVQDIAVFAVGKKILFDVRRLKGIRLIDPPKSFEEKDYARATRELADTLMDGFLSGEYDRVEVVYTFYKSIGTQLVRNRQFLPFVAETETEEPEVLKKEAWYIYEPDCQGVLEMMYPLLLHAAMHESFLQNRTSEQAARILAMQLANDNAVKLLGKLQLEYNKLRQQGITTELLDIAGGQRDL